MTTQKLLIMYASKRGSTRDVVNVISHSLPFACHIYDCANKQLSTDHSNTVMSPDQLSLHNYNFILIGSPMYMGAPLKAVKQFLVKYEKDLSVHEFGLFTCGVGSKEEDYGYLKNQLPASLFDKALCYYHLGGEVREDQMNFLERLAMKEYVRQHGPVTGIDQNAIEQLCSYINERLSM